MIALFGCVNLINKIVPMEAGIAIVLWIGVVIAAQAYQATPKAHAPAVVVGLFPAFAAWGMNLLKRGYLGAGTTMSAEVAKGVPINGFMGMAALESGFIFTSMILAAVSVFLIERDFLKAVVLVARGGGARRSSASFTRTRSWGTRRSRCTGGTSAGGSHSAICASPPSFCSSICGSGSGERRACPSESSSARNSAAIP